MKRKRRDFIKIAGITGMGMAGNGMFPGFAATLHDHTTSNGIAAVNNKNYIAGNLSLIGQYGDWASSLTGNKLPSLSFRKKEFTNLQDWKKMATRKLTERLSVPDIGGLPPVKVNKQYVYDGLQIEELSWQLPYGRATEAIVLKPENSKGKLPAILAFHDHGGNKYFGTRKITKTSGDQHPLMQEHQKEYYVHEIRAMLDRAGFQIVDTKGISPMPESIQRGVFDFQEAIANIGLSDNPEEGYMFYLRAQKPL